MCGGYACVAVKNDGTAEAWGDPDWGGDATAVDLTNVATAMCGGMACVAVKLADSDYASCTIPGDCTTLHLRACEEGWPGSTCSTGLNVGAIPAGPLAEALKGNTALTTLEIIDVNFGDVGMAALGGALETNAAITTLVHSCFYCSEGFHLGDDGVEALAKALETSTTALTTLNLVNNKIGDDGAAALAGALQVNSKVTHLSINENDVGDVGASAFAEMLKVNTALIQLDIGSGYIGNVGAAALDEALKVNSVLTDMNLDLGYDFTDSTISASIGASLAANKNPTCADSKRNGDEVGIDCGGVACNACPGSYGKCVLPIPRLLVCLLLSLFQNVWR